MKEELRIQNEEVKTLTMKTKLKIATALLLLSTLNAQLSTAHAQGSLTPPGPPAPTMKTLAQIEPRTPISSTPIIITSPGSYYLTTNLTVVGFNVNGITINSDDVTLDLGGFVITGDGSLNNSGVQVSTPHFNICVRNGTIRNIGGGAGVYAAKASNSRFEQLMLYANGEDGINAGTGARVIGCVAQANGVTGIELGQGSVARDCVSQLNGIGFSTGIACVVADCSAVSNSFGGLTCGYGNRLQGCTAAYNNNYPGITTTNGCTISGCSVYGNPSGGIVAGRGCIITDCSVFNNSGNGIQANNSLVRDCNVSENYIGIYVAGSTVSGCTVQKNRTDGISVQKGDYYTPGCLIIGNNCQGNCQSDSGLGTANINIYSSFNRIEGNHVVTQLTAPGISTFAGISATNNVITRNSVYGYNNYLVLGNDVGPIGVAATAISPWANIAH
jgi:parallel beta-helix repeat protein